MQQLEFSDDNNSTIAGSAVASNDNRKSIANGQIFFDKEYDSDSDSEEDGEENWGQPNQLSIGMLTPAFYPM